MQQQITKGFDYFLKQNELGKTDSNSIDLSIFSASEFASESSISLAIASNVRLMKLR
jgi:hypothetical protein